MIKVIAFDFVGVLANEKDVDLLPVEDKLERLFGPNLSADEYLAKAKNIIDEDQLSIINTTKNIINKLYKIKNTEIFKKIKQKNNNLKLIVATNHVSFIEEFIKNSFDSSYIDDIIISANIHKIKPNADFYEYILKKYNIKSEELLFLDDNTENITGAKNLGIQTIKVEKHTDQFNEINKFL